MSGMMPAYILREIDNDGKLLAGGLVWYFESGTTTPKAVYSDATYSTPLSNPVVLDAGGAADIWLANGAYRVRVCDRNGVQVRPPIDGVVGVGGSVFGGPGSNVSGVAVKTYDDVRALVTPPDTVYVSGAYIEGDGGAGWFQLLPSTTLVDDDGIILATSVGSYTYKRIFDGVIDPSWYSVRYGLSVDNTDALNNALAASVTWNYPVMLAGSVYISQNIVVPAGASLHCGIDGFLNSASAVSVTFQTGSKLSSEGVVFGPTVNPTFQQHVALDALYLSWFGGSTDQDRWSKLAACTTYDYHAYADTTTTISLNLTVPKHISVDFVGGAQLIIDAALDLNIGNLVYDGLQPIIIYQSAAYVQSIALGPVHARPEWFGAVGNNIADDTIASTAAMRCGSVLGRCGSTYKAITSISCDSTIIVSDLSLPGPLPTFRFEGGLTVSSGSITRVNDTNVFVIGGTLRAYTATNGSLSIGGLVIGGTLRLDNSSLYLTSACTSTATRFGFATSTSIQAGHLLPAMYWSLEGCGISASDYMTVAEARTSAFDCRLVAFQQSGETVEINGCSVTNLTYLPMISAAALTNVDVKATKFVNASGIPGIYSWADSTNWRWAMSDTKARCTYTGCTQNNAPVWDPHAASIDGVAVTWFRGTTAPLPYASWTGLPGAVSAYLDGLKAGSAVDTTHALVDGSGWTTTGWHGTGSAMTNDFGFAMVNIDLVSSDPAAYVDVVTATSPVYVNKADYPGNAFPPVSMLVRNVSPKAATRVMSGQSILLPVWIGAGDTTAVADGSLSMQVNTRVTSTKLQMQIIRWSVPANAIVNVTIREGVCTDPTIFAALYHKPDLISVPYSFPETGYKRLIDTVSFLGSIPTADGGYKLLLRGNEMRYTAGHPANDGRYFTWHPISSSQLETIIGVSYARGGPVNVAPPGIGAEVYRSGNPNGALLSFDNDASTGYTGYRILSASNVTD